MNNSTYEDILIQIPNQEIEVKEKDYINPEKEYFAVTTKEFMIYSKQKKTWYCLITKLIIPGAISDIIDENGAFWLHVANKQMTHGKWGTADNMDDILDFFNSGDFLKWLKENS